MVAENQHYLKLDQLNVIIRRVCYIEDEGEIALMLDFYQDLGKIIKHNNTVLLRARWLIDVFKKLITICPFEKSVRNKMSRPCLHYTVRMIYTRADRLVLSYFFVTTIIVTSLATLV